MAEALEVNEDKFRVYFKLKEIEKFCGSKSLKRVIPLLFRVRLNFHRFFFFKFDSYTLKMLSFFI